MSVRDLLDDDPDWSEDDFNMTFYEYEEAAMNHAIYDNDLIYPVLGLLSEAGEVADKVKKIMRDEEIEILDPILDLERRAAQSHRAGAVRCPLVFDRHSADIGYELEEIASLNIDKLDSRSRRGRIRGSGDYR